MFSMQDYEQRLKGAEAKNAELAGLLEKAKPASDHHARIMELQVRTDMAGVEPHPS